MRANRYYFLLILSLLVAGGLSAQDKLFTQAFAHPVDLSPALTGNVEGRYRVTVAYRDQWRGLIESAFTTMGVYGDIQIRPNDRKADFFGAGFSVVSDRTAYFNANQNLISLFGSFHKSLNPDRGSFISAGLSMGIAQRNLNYENLFFNDQFNGLDDYSLGTNENLPANNFAFMDLGLGVGFSTRLGDYSRLAAGVAMDHVPGASISFFRRSLDPDEIYPDSRLDRKLTAYLTTELASNEFVSVLPRVIWQQQGPHRMLSAAALVKFDITNYDTQAVHLGGGVRLNQDAFSGFGPTAAFLMAAYEAGGFLIGLSHDVSLTRLATDHPGRGAFELSISFTGEYHNEESLCPTF